jgi:Xaa-Pro aminopeptidase
MGLAYETISASGPNAALPHYTPKKATARVIDRETPYLKYAMCFSFLIVCLIIFSDSGGQYRDGTCDTTRTLHFGRPTPYMSEAYTRVVQGHVSNLLYRSLRIPLTYCS